MRTMSVRNIIVVDKSEKRLDFVKMKKTGAVVLAVPVF